MPSSKNNQYTSINEKTGENKIISVENLSFSYRKNEWIYQDLNFSINKGEMIAIAGESGSGKTTLCYILKGIIPHEVKGKIKGNILVAGFDIKKTKISKIAKKVGMVFQDLNSQLFNNTVLEEVEFGLKNLKMDLSYAPEALDKLGIKDLSSKIPMNLSAGQKQRVILASILALRPEVLILDEPSIHLDPKNKIMLRDWLIELNEETNMTIIVASNDPYLIGSLCKNILFIEGKSISRRPKEALMKQEPHWRWSY